MRSQWNIPMPPHFLTTFDLLFFFVATLVLGDKSELILNPYPNKLVTYTSSIFNLLVSENDILFLRLIR